MPRHQSLTTKQKSSIKFFAEIAVVIISIISLYFSWQSNQISKTTSQPQILILDQYPIAYDKWTENEVVEHVVCRTLIRIANVGGVDTDLFDASVKFTAGDISKIVQVSQKMTSIRRETLEGDLDIYASIWKHDSNDIRTPNPISRDGLYYDLPISLKSHTTSDIYIDTYFWYPKPSFEFRAGNATNNPNFDPSSYKMVDVSFNFQFPVEGTISTNPIVCAYYK